MIKKFISMSTAVLLMASGISFIGMTSANASAPTLTDLGYFDGGPRSMPGFSSSTTDYAVTANSNSVFITTHNSPGGSTQVHTCNGSVITPGGTPPCFLNSGANTYTIVVSQGGLSTTYTITFNYSPPAPVNLGLSSSSTIKGASISSLGVGNRDPRSVTRGSVTLTSTQAADVSNSGSFVTAFSAVSGSAEVAAINIYARGVTPFYVGGPTSLNIYNGTAALSDGDFFQLAVASRSNGANYLWYIIEVTVTTGGGGGSSSSGLTPLFAAASAFEGGFSVQISNYDEAFTYTATTTAGSVSINPAGLISVFSLRPNQAATVNVTTTRSGYSTESGSVTSSSQVTPLITILALADFPTISIINNQLIYNTGNFVTPTGIVSSLYVNNVYISSIASGDLIPWWLINGANSTSIIYNQILNLKDINFNIDQYLNQNIRIETVAYKDNAIAIISSNILIHKILNNKKGNYDSIIDNSSITI